MFRKIHITILTFLLFTLSHAYGQQWEFGANLSGSGYMGDINPANPFYYKNFSGGLHVKYNFNPTWGVRTGISYLKLYGADEDFNSNYQKQRNLAFNNNVFELSAVGEFNFFKFIAGREDTRYTPYLFAGVAAFMHNPYLKSSDGTIHKLRELFLENDVEQGTFEKPSNVAVSIPFGAGFKYNIKGPWTLGVEIGYRAALTDQLDNVSNNYTTLTYNDLPSSVRSQISEDTWTFLADPSGNLPQNAGKMRGNGKGLDGYMTAGFTVTYTLFSQKCYWW